LQAVCKKLKWSSITNLSDTDPVIMTFGTYHAKELCQSLRGHINLDCEIHN